MLFFKLRRIREVQRMTSFEQCRREHSHSSTGVRVMNNAWHCSLQQVSTCTTFRNGVCTVYHYSSHAPLTLLLQVYCGMCWCTSVNWKKQCANLSLLRFTPWAIYERIQIQKWHTHTAHICTLFQVSSFFPIYGLYPFYMCIYIFFFFYSCASKCWFM